jgi:hypothetical protein
LSKKINKDNMQKIMGKALYTVLPAKVYLVLGSNLQSKYSSILAMSAFMGSGKVHIVNDGKPKMAAQAHMVLDVNPSKVIDMLMTNFELEPSKFEMKKNIKLTYKDNILTVRGID